MTLPEIVTGNFQPEEVLRMLEDDSRRRLGVVCLEDCWWVRANYGHSVDLPVRALPQLVTHLSVTLLTLLPSDDLGCDQMGPGNVAGQRFRASELGPEFRPYLSKIIANL